MRLAILLLLASCGTACTCPRPTAPKVVLVPTPPEVAPPCLADLPPPEERPVERTRDGCPSHVAVCLSPANAVAEALNLDEYRTWVRQAIARCAASPTP